MRSSVEDVADTELLNSSPMPAEFQDHPKNTAECPRTPNDQPVHTRGWSSFNDNARPWWNAGRTIVFMAAKDRLCLGCRRKAFVWELCGAMRVTKRARGSCAKLRVS